MSTFSLSSFSNDFRGKTYWISGASSGIGAATALALGRAGAQVALVARRREPMEELATRIGAAGGQALVLPTDVTDELQVRDAVAATVQRFGRLDGAFNNAGALGPSGSLHQLATTGLDAVFKANVSSVFGPCSTRSAPCWAVAVVPS